MENPNKSINRTTEKIQNMANTPYSSWSDYSSRSDLPKTTAISNICCKLMKRAFLTALLKSTCISNLYLLRSCAIEFSIMNIKYYHKWNTPMRLLSVTILYR
ncbi:hypothetical protein ZeamMp049 (mitochondrion) [Zea mays subsp. mays]|uniref:Uncharacterized protein orf101-b n=1 Tax=Zea mays TaxID=4577 RepID=Q6R9J7_MAIZE|nr:hypothetical protein ZeamMp049 [Zea mays subsp. mays]AAR91174.1 hypothetical protein [Zea mays]|eukprot:YP_588311.1 hypothetical protein ZeamMp049 (mitochondrion) [Zea mays subsp. mays]